VAEVNPVRPLVTVSPDSLLEGSSLALEHLVEAVRQYPTVLVRAALWAARGGEHLRRELAGRVEIDAAALPYRADALAALRREASGGARVILAGGGFEDASRRMAGHLGIFDASGLPAEASWAPPRRAARLSMAVLARALRPHQWLKNTLVFLPFLLAHEFGRTEKWAAAALMFAAFSLCASASYVINDILDRAQDGRHPRRSLRPIASGALPLRAALWLPAPLAAAAAVCCLFLPRPAEWRWLHTWG
jgi:hypothetical protein